MKTLLMETGAISNKAIIISLVKQLELTHELDKSLVLRSALEIIVGTVSYTHLTLPTIA
ncbi:biofilm development regulator YmgB/AriR family protein [Rosenbergiella epipactidis]|uniref:biofilm development regulator YmgB/AriR family protein n=1 Tax=Rosenbergiella epipactidis TaxID=1544694 RepID=UPI001F4FB943